MGIRSTENTQNAEKKTWSESETESDSTNSITRWQLTSISWFSIQNLSRSELCNIDGIVSRWRAGESHVSLYLCLYYLSLYQAVCKYSVRIIRSKTSQRNSSICCRAEEMHQMYEIETQRKKINWTQIRKTSVYSTHSHVIMAYLESTCLFCACHVIASMELRSTRVYFWTMRLHQPNKAHLGGFGIFLENNYVIRFCLALYRTVSRIYTSHAVVQYVGFRIF